MVSELSKKNYWEIGKRGRRRRRRRRRRRMSHAGH